MLLVMDIKHRPSHSVSYLQKDLFYRCGKQMLSSLLGNILHVEELGIILNNKLPTFIKIWKPIRLFLHALHTYYMPIFFSPLNQVFIIICFMPLLIILSGYFNFCCCCPPGEMIVYFSFVTHVQYAFC